jgi:hypothetical protein
MANHCNHILLCIYEKERQKKQKKKKEIEQVQIEIDKQLWAKTIR